MLKVCEDLNFVLLEVGYRKKSCEKINFFFMYYLIIV